MSSQSPDNQPRVEPGASFSAPPPVDRPMAFWSWNGEIDETGIDRWLEDFRAKGMGGAFVHPRPGLVTEYLSDRWWELWAHALRTADRLGLHLQIYDENSYPAGFAGGHVPAHDPSTVASFITVQPIATAEQAAGVRAISFMEIDGLTARAVSRDDAQARVGSGARIAAVVLARSEARGFTAGYGYVDLTYPDTTKAFLKATHQEYARRFDASFGTTIRYAFTDEPNPYHGDGFAFSSYLSSEFCDEHGYRLEDRIADLWFGDGTLRYDYFKTLNRLFLDNFVTPIDEWCREHGLGFTGHYWEHAWPSPGKQPDNMAAMARMGVPGNDLLEFQINRESFWPMAVLNLKELSSVASQTGAQRTLVENGGAGGYDTTIRDFQRTDNTLLAFGVTGYAAHLSHYSLAGSRKYEWPQTLGEPASWWRVYRRHADHVARLTTLLVAGEEHNRVALLEPTRSGWTNHAPGSLRILNAETAAARDDAQATLERDFCSLVLELFERGIDFDLVAEDALERAFTDETGRITVGERSYELVAIAATTVVLGTETARSLARFVDSGATVFVAGESPLLDARPDRPAAELVSCAIPVADDTALAERITAAVPPRHITQRIPRGCAWHRRVLAGGDVLTIFTNSTDEPATIEWRPEWTRTYRLDTAAANLSAMETDDVVRTRLGPRGLEAFLVTDGDPEDRGFTVAEGAPAARVLPLAAGTSADPENASSVEARLASLRRLDPNALVIDYCDVSRENEEHRDRYVLDADRMLWQWAGCAGNAWDRAVQFRRTILERTYRKVKPTVTYTFEASPELASSSRIDVSIVVERVALWRVRVNGSRIATDAWKRWRMDDFFIADISSLVRAGANSIELSADEFHPLMEIAPMIVAGDFAVQPGDRGFAIAPSQAPQIGDLAAGGHPFYFGETEYTYEAGLGDFRSASDGSSEIDLHVPFAGAFVEVSIPGLDPLVAFQAPARIRVAREAIAGDRMTFTVRTGASAQNLFGPFHSKGLALSMTWEKSPEHQPPGTAYRVSAHGVTGPVVVSEADDAHGVSGGAT